MKLLAIFLITLGVVGSVSIGLHKFSKDKELIKVSGIIFRVLFIPLGFYLLSVSPIIERPYIDIKPDNMEFSKWTYKEKIEDPEITERADKILLYFLVENSTKNTSLCRY